MLVLPLTVPTNGTNATSEQWRELLLVKLYYEGMRETLNKKKQVCLSKN